MASIGKSAKSLRRVDLQSQRTPSVASQKIVFAHKCVGGESGISLIALTTPTAEMPNFSNPPLATLFSANLKTFKNNLMLVSNHRGAMQQALDYEVGNSTQINFRGFVAQTDEIFTGTIDAIPTTQPMVVNVTPIKQ